MLANKGVPKALVWQSRFTCCSCAALAHARCNGAAICYTTVLLLLNSLLLMLPPSLNPPSLQLRPTGLCQGGPQQRQQHLWQARQRVESLNNNLISTGAVMVTMPSMLVAGASGVFHETLLALLRSDGLGDAIMCQSPAERLMTSLRAAGSGNALHSCAGARRPVGKQRVCMSFLTLQLEIFSSHVKYVALVLCRSLHSMHRKKKAVQAKLN